MPKRIQLRRTKGWRKPAGCVSVGRGTRWGNPFKLSGFIDHRYVRADLRESTPLQWCSPMAVDARKAVESFWMNLFRGTLTYTLDDVRRELRGKDLACWCKPGSWYHADMLMQIAND
jgi:hypothetical protein